MTKKELLDKLKGLPDDAEILIGSVHVADSGTLFSPKAVDTFAEVPGSTVFCVLVVVECLS